MTSRGQDSIKLALAPLPAEDTARESEAWYRTIFANTGSATIILDADMTISLANDQFVRFSGYTRAEVEGRMKVVDFLDGQEKRRLSKYHVMRRLDPNSVPSHYEALARDRFGNERFILVTVAVLPNSSKSVFSFVDITERKQLEEELRYLSRHDPLTGLFDRAYFEMAMRRVDGTAATAAVVGDIDGLKRINDAFGHDVGDAVLRTAAKFIRQAFPSDAVVSRVGSDSFAVLLVNHPESVTWKGCEHVHQSVHLHNATRSSPELHISLGCAWTDNPGANTGDLCRQADDLMVRNKLHSGQSTHSAAIRLLGQTLQARDFITGGHATRMKSYMQLICRHLGEIECNLADLLLFAQFHDIGKIGVPDRVLLKPGPLTPAERVEMQLHCETGYRIARSSTELQPIAEWILRHHEWWNGAGYPLGISGHAIPLACRILAIVDAYDAMTSARPYRPAISPAEATQELRRCQGVQFDPNLVDVFLDCLANVGHESSPRFGIPAPSTD